MAVEKPLVTVTGATGFIAKHLVLALLNSGYRVRGTSRSARRAGEMVSALTSGIEQGVDLSSDFELVSADLESDEGWAAAFEGAEAVLHTASPFPATTPRDEQALIRPAVEGTRRVLSAAANAGVRRAVVTSSAAAVYYGHPHRDVFDESVWTDLEGPGVSAYTKSKTLAEQSAWAIAEEKGLALSVINPTLVLGPVLDRNYGTSARIVESLMTGRMPAIPNLSFGVVDVRDVADLHVRALETSESVGKRYLGVTSVEWIGDLAVMLRETYPTARVPRMRLPDWVIRAGGLVNKDMKSLVPDLGRKVAMQNGAGEALLGRPFRDARTATLDMAQSLVTQGAIKRLQSH